MSDSLTLFAGTANPDLAMAVARELGVPLGGCAIERFPDGEVSVRLNEPVRGHEVFIVQPTSLPVNEHLIELLAFVDACRRASAAQITVIVPYFGYARSDKRHGRREPIMASMVALLLQVVGVERIVTIDLHAPQIEGFSHIPVDSLSAVPMLADALLGRLTDGIVIAASDANAVRLASRYAHRLKTSVVALHKQRESGTETKVTHLVGDVRDRPCLIVDDMISTGGTIAEAIEALLESGARPEITVAVTHGLLLTGAREKLSQEAVRELLVTDTVPVAMDGWPQLWVISVAPLLARALKRLMADGSLSDLYTENGHKVI
jgi:ribose-phosphate pyrophosphokinase